MWWASVLYSNRVVIKVLIKNADVAYIMSARPLASAIMSTMLYTDRDRIVLLGDKLIVKLIK